MLIIPLLYKDPFNFALTGSQQTILENVFFYTGFISLTVTTPSNILVSSGQNSSIILNCTFEDQAYTKVTRIVWSKKGENKYNWIATFTSYEAICLDEDLGNRSSLVTYGSNSSSAIMFISDIRCEDDGQYQCIVGVLQLDKTSYTTVFVKGIIFKN